MEDAVSDAGGFGPCPNIAFVIPGSRAQSQALLGITLLTPRPEPIVTLHHQGSPTIARVVIGVSWKEAKSSAGDGPSS